MKDEKEKHPHKPEDAAESELSELTGYPDATCQHCGEECETTEVVYTGDSESTDGNELWCYCKPCRLDTFHLLG